MPSQTSTPGKGAPKTMSSRLMTMKFMQRAAAGSTSSPNQPNPRSLVGSGTKTFTTVSSHNRSPKHDSIHVSKKPKIDTDSAGDESEANQTEHRLDRNERSQTDFDRVRAALEEEEAKRERAIERLAAEAGETKWVLSTIESKISTQTTQDDGKRLRIVKAGYAEIDVDKGQSPWSKEGRKRFGRHGQDDEHKINTHLSESSEGEAFNVGESGQEDEGLKFDGKRDLDAEQLIRVTKEDLLKQERAGRKKKRKVENAEPEQLAERPKNEVKLNKLLSISSNGNSGEVDQRKCFHCGESGHMRKDCPTRSFRKGQDDFRNKRPAKRANRDMTTLDY